MYKQVPCYDDQGELFQFILVEVASGPAVPPESVFEEPETPAQETFPEENVVDSMEETTSVEVAASSSGSTSIDRTEDSESELEDKVVEEKTREQVYLVISTLDEYDFDDNLRTSDGFYLTNVDGKHVWNFD